MTIEIVKDWTGAFWPYMGTHQICGVDTETTGVKQEDRAVSCGVAVPGLPPYWFSWGHDSGNNCTVEEFREWAQRELEHPYLLRVFHNAQFDLRMLHSAGVTLKLERVEDTAILAPLIDELSPELSLDYLSQKYLSQTKLDDAPLNEWCAKQFGRKADFKSQVKNYYRAPGYMVADYCTTDAQLALQLHDALRPLIDVPDDEGFDLSKVYELETKLIPILVMMNRVGFRVDVEAANRLESDIQEMIDAKLEAWEKIGEGVNVNSSPQMAKLLDKFGISVPMTEKGNPSVSADVLSGIDHPVASLALDIRKLDKFKDTFVRNYVIKNATAEGLIHGQFHQLKKSDHRGSVTGTVSGRFSSSGGLNLQNLPAPDPDQAHLLKYQLAERVRGLFVPHRTDQQMLSIDYSQIEFRLIAHYGGGKLREEYVRNPDVDFHTMVSELTGIPRKPAKNINFGLAYGMGQKLMAERLAVSVEEAKVMLDKYHFRLPEVRSIYDRTMRRAMKRGYVRTLLGRRRHFEPDPECRFGPYKFTHKALNALAQGGGADIMKLAMVAVLDLVDWNDLVIDATVHDELVMSAPKGAAGDRIIRELKERMENLPIELTVPILAECKVGPSWGTVRKWRPYEGAVTRANNLEGMLTEWEP